MTDLNPIGTALQSTGATTTSSGDNGAAADQLASDFDTFLTLLTEQLKNQDPTSPMDTETFISQLVEFSSVEQLINTSESLETLLTLQTATTQMAAADFVGKNVIASTDEAMLTDGAATWNYELPYTAETVDISIYDESGRLMNTYSGPADEGTHVVGWDGTDNLGNQVESGLYRLEVNAIDADGAVMSVDISTSGYASSVVMTGDDVTVSVNGNSVPAGQIIAVSA